MSAIQTKTGLWSVVQIEALTTEPLAELYDAHGPRLFRYALMILADVAAAEDAVQEAFVHVARALRRTRPPEVSYAYLATVVRNECFTSLRKRRRSREEPLPLLIEREAPDAPEDERVILNAALAALPAEQREAIYLKVFEGMTFQEIADRCGVSINTAASRYRYATAALRRALASGTEKR